MGIAHGIPFLCSISRPHRRGIQRRLLQVNVELTPEGLANRFKVLTALFSYLDLIRKEGVPGFLYPEQKALSDLGWRYQDKQEPSSLVPAVASSLQEYPPELALRY